MVDSGVGELHGPTCVQTSAVVAKRPASSVASARPIRSKNKDEGGMSIANKRKKGLSVFKNQRRTNKADRQKRKANNRSKCQHERFDPPPRRGCVACVVVAYNQQGLFSETFSTGAVSFHPLAVGRKRRKKVYQPRKQ